MKYRASFFSALLDKYKSINTPVKASFWFLICSVLQKGIAMLTTPIFTRIMTEEAYGKYTLYNSWYTIVFAIVTLNLAAGVYTRGLVANEEDQSVYSSSLVGLSTLCIFLGFVIYIIFIKPVNRLLGFSTFIMTLMFIEMWSNSIFQFWSHRERANYKYRKLVILTLSYILIRSLLSVITVLAVNAEYQMQSRVIITTAVGFVFYFGLFVKFVTEGKALYSKNYWKHALTFNIPLIPHYLSQIILNQSDKIMIGKLCGETDVAYYSVAYSIAMLLLILNSSINSTMNPWMYRKIKEKNYCEIEKVSYIVLVMIAICNFFVVAIGPELLSFIAPVSYQNAVWLIPPLTISVYFIFLYSLFATFEYYYSKTNYVAIASVLGAILNLLLNYIFIKYFGYIAAGYTTMVCYISYVMLHYLFMRKVNKKFMDNVKVYKISTILLIGMFLVMASALMMMLYNYIVVRYVIILLLLIIVACNLKRIVTKFRTMFG